jgi:hypothetical protein
MTTIPNPTVAELEEAIGMPKVDWARNCHGVSLAIVRSGIMPAGARVARGFCTGVPSQHSWVIVGGCYDWAAPIVDATLWSYDPSVPTIWRGTYEHQRHQPHGWAPLDRAWARGGGLRSTGERPELHLGVELGRVAQRFLDEVGPLDAQGWMRLLSGPLIGWPATEIITAAYADDRLRGLIPIDAVGMLTDINPGGMYF